MSNSGSKGNSGNTNGGTETSFTKTPQAKDDSLGTLQSGTLNYINTVYYLDVMANDLAGKAKSLWSVDDGNNDSGAMSGYEAGDLLTQDLPGATGVAANRSQFGAAIWVTPDGKVAYDTSTIDAPTAADLTGLALGETMTDSFIYAIRMANGTLSWARASVTLTGVNDTPTVEAVSVDAVEDGASVTGSFLGDDVDSDDDINSLIYSIIGGPDTGTLSNNGDGTFSYDPGKNFQSLSEGQTADFELTYTATDKHGAVSDPASLKITVTGVNDDPTLAAGAMAAVEDGPAVTLDLSALGDDVDGENDGSNLIYSVTGDPAEGSAAISGTTLTFDTEGGFQDLGLGLTRDVVVEVTATDKRGGTATNNVTVTVTGMNDDPTLAAGALAASEEGPVVSLDLSTLADDIDNDDDSGSLTYALLDDAPAGSATLTGSILSFDPLLDVFTDKGKGFSPKPFDPLAAGQTTSFDLAVQVTDKHGATADSVVTVTVTGVNDAPKLQSASVAATEDGQAVTLDLSLRGSDIDSDDDGSTLAYSISGAPAKGSASISGTTFSFDPGSEFQYLAKGEVEDVAVQVTATDRHNASGTNTIVVNVTGVNDDPTLAAGALAASEGGPTVTLDLATLGDDLDSDDDGSTLAYSITGYTGATSSSTTTSSSSTSSSESKSSSSSSSSSSSTSTTTETTKSTGNASISGTTLSFNPGSDYQSLAAGETLDVVVQVTATDKHGASATNNITVTVTGTNDAPQISGDAQGAVTLQPGKTPFTVEQWTKYSGGLSLDSLTKHANNNAPNYTITTSTIDFTDDPSGFAGELPGSTPWPAAIATNTTGTVGINDYFFARVTANILITAADTYTFRTFNDDGVFLSVNNQLIINDPNIHGEQAFTGTIALTPGVYPLELYYFENNGEASLELSFKDSSGIYQLLDTSDATDSGTLNFTDVDLSDVHGVSVAPVNSVLGALTAVVVTDTTGTGTGGVVSWEYQIANDAYQSLPEGVTAVESFVVTVDDGNGGTAQQQVDITITGGNDVAVLGTAVANLTETDSPLSASGTLSISDPDNGEAFFNIQSNTGGTYGKFSIAADGSWSYNTNDALNVLTEGQVVSDVFNVSSIDGTATTVTVTMTGTADGPSGVNDSNSLTASKAAANTSNVVYWADWQSADLLGGGVGQDKYVRVNGTITLGDGHTISVSYEGLAWIVQLGQNQPAPGLLNYSSTTSEWIEYSPAPYTSSQVNQGPQAWDIIGLNEAFTSGGFQDGSKTDYSPRNLTFSEPVDNLFFAVNSMNSNGYTFDQNFQIVSQGRGKYGDSADITPTDFGNGQYGIVSQPKPDSPNFGQSEFHGVLKIDGSVEELTWTSQNKEVWNGFTVGTYGKAQSATASGNVLSNDDVGTLGSSIEVSAVNGSSMVGNSVTLTLASGAIIKIDRDGDYLYDDNNQFDYLDEGEIYTEIVEYTLTDDLGNNDTASLSIQIVGVAP